MIQEINDKNFHTKVSSDKSDKPILVDFWAPWCTPCKTLSILLEEIYLEEYKNKAIFFKINVDENPQCSSKYGIRSIPTLIFFKNGKKKDIYIGVSSKENIRKKLDTI